MFIMNEMIMLNFVLLNSHYSNSLCYKLAKGKITLNGLMPFSVLFSTGLRAIFACSTVLLPETPIFTHNKIKINKT